MPRMKSKIIKGDRRAKRIRRRLRESGRLRLSVFRSSRYIYAQVIDDSDHCTVVATNSRDALRSGKLKVGGNIEAAAYVGKEIAGKAKEAGVSSVVFDRGPYRFHGRIKALAEAARKAGLEF